MPKMKRRHFLQFSASTLASIGLSQTNFLRQANHYGNALAQSTSRKLALLIGINSYPDPAVGDLSGCLNDVKMQHNLLVHRFGFNPSDIVKLTDDDPSMLPSRENILQAFEEHLIKQAQPGDIVVVHYSGHGARVTDPDPILVAACQQNSDGFSNEAGLNGTLVPNNPTDPNQTGSEIVVPDIMGRSLFLLMERINTENLTVVLDSCFSGAGTRGNASVRAINSRLGREGESFIASPEEFENQKRWLTDLGMTPEEFQKKRTEGIAKGVTLGSASCNQLAFELPMSPDHVSGTFTYLLTSYLWQSPSAERADTIEANLIRSTRTTVNRGTQIPIFEYKPGSQNSQQPLYFSELSPVFAAGVVTNITDGQIQLWLGGVSHQNIDTASSGTVYSVLTAEGQEVADLVLEQRVGLTGFGRLAEGQSVTVEEGMLVREKVLAIPAPFLKIGVDPSLGSETSEAETALQTALSTTSESSGQTVSRLTVLPINQQSDIEYLLARTTPDIQQLLRDAGETTPPPVGTIAIFAPDFSSVVPSTFDAVDEPVTVAVNRLRPRLKSLLVGKVLKALAIATTSDFNVSGEVFDGSGRGVSVPIVSSPGESRSINRVMVSTEPFYTNEEIRIRIKNEEPNPVYLSVLGIGSDGQIIVLQPVDWNDPVEAARVDRGEELTVPRQQDIVLFRLAGTGYVELITLVSKEPLRALLQSLQTISRGTIGQSSQRFIGLEEGDPLNLVTDLLSDLDSASRSANNNALIVTETTQEISAVDSRAVAVFSTVIEVVENPNEPAS